jgi:hypothetical protein
MPYAVSALAERRYLRQQEEIQAAERPRGLCESQNSRRAEKSAALDRVRLGAVEIAIYAAKIVGTPYVFPLCVVIAFASGCYVCSCWRRWCICRPALQFFASAHFSGCEDIELFLSTQIAYNENIMYQSHESNSRKFYAWQGSCYLILSYKKVVNH